MITSSICIVTRNRTVALRRCLTAVSKLSKQPNEIIVIENNPVKHLSSLIESFPNLNIIYKLETTPNIAAARNKAILVSSKQLVIFLDDDCVPKTNWLVEIERGFVDNNVIAVVGRSDNYNIHSVVAKAEQILFNNWFSQFYSRNHSTQFHSGEFFNSRNVAIRRSFLVRTYCLFNLKAPHKIEDTDFGIRIFQIKLNNEKVIFNPKAVVLHENSNSLSAFFLRRFYSGKGKHYLDKTYPDWEMRVSKYKLFAKQKILLIRLLLWLERQFFRIGYFSARIQNIFTNKLNTSGTRKIPTQPNSWTTYSVEIQTLLCKRDVDNFIFSMAQLFNVLGYRIPIRVYPDASIGKNDIKLIKSSLQKVVIVNSNTALSQLDPWMRDKNFFSKRFISFNYSSAEKLIFLDSDVLFLQKPKLIDFWIKSETAKNYYLKDVGNYYSFSNFEFRNISKSFLVRKVSAGLLLINRKKSLPIIKKSIDMGIKTIKKLEKQRVIGGFKEQQYWYLDQTIWANILFRTKAKILPKTYCVYADLDLDNHYIPNVITAIHFSGPYKNQLKHYQSEIQRCNLTY